MQSGWDQVRGLPDYGRRKSRPHPYANSPLSPARATQFPSALPTVNPGLVNYNRGELVHTLMIDYMLRCAVGATPYTHSGLHSHDARLDAILYQLFQVPPSKLDWNHRAGVLSWAPSSRIEPPSIPPVTPAQPRKLPRPMPPPIPSSTPSRVVPPIIRPQRRSSNNITLHPCLTYNSGQSWSPNPVFDVSKPPTNARIRKNDLNYTAVFSVQSRITNLPSYTSHRCVLSFDRDVLAQHILDISNLTIENFLWVVYDYFQEPLSASELRRLQRSSAQYERAVRAMERRCSTAIRTERAWSRGLRRIDCLGSGTWYQGMYVEDGQAGCDISLRISFMEHP